MDWSALLGYLPELTVMAAAVGPFIKPGREWLSSWLGRKRKRSASGQSDAREGGRRPNQSRYSLTTLPSTGCPQELDLGATCGNLTRNLSLASHMNKCCRAA